MDRLQVELARVRRQLEAAIDEACQTAREHEQARSLAAAAADAERINQSRRMELISLGRATALTWVLSLIDDAITRAEQPVMPKGTDRLVFIGSKLPGMDDYPPLPDAPATAAAAPDSAPALELRRS